MIEKLTPEQEAYLPIFRQKFIDDITTRRDFEIQKNAINSLYEFCNFSKPQHILCLPPEYARNLMASLEILESHGYSDLNKALEALSSPIDNADTAKQIVEGLLGKTISDFHNIFDTTRGNTENILSVLWHRSYSAWLQFGKYIGAVLDEDKLALLSSVADNIDACYCYENICIIIDNPIEIHWLDEQLHNESGPAVRYSDGFEIYCIEGHRLTKEIVMNPSSITVEQIKAEQNMEIRRILIALYGGYEKYLADIGATLLDADLKGAHGFAARALMLDDQGNKIMICTDGSTDRTYALEVGAEADTCKQAHESVSLLPEENMIAEG